MTEAPDIITQIISAPPPAVPGFHMLVGPKQVQDLVLFSLVRRLHAGRTVHWIDAGNRFNAHGLAVAARAAGLDERQVLARVQVARPFTAIQLTAMLSRKVPLLPASSPVIVSDPMKLFYDEEMPEDEVARVFRDFIDAVKGLGSPVLALGIERDAPEGRRGLSRRLLQEVKSLSWMKELPLLE